MSQTTVLAARRRGFLGPLMISAVFLVVSVRAVGRSGWAWLPISFFGVGACLMAIQLLPGASWLRISERALEVCSLFRVRSYRWDDVGPFGVRWIPFQRVVTFTSEQGSRSRARWLPDSYGMQPNALAELLNDRRRQWAA